MSKPVCIDCGQPFLDGEERAVTLTGKPGTYSHGKMSICNGRLRLRVEEQAQQLAEAAEREKAYQLAVQRVADSHTSMMTHGTDLRKGTHALLHAEAVGALEALALAGPSGGVAGRIKCSRCGKAVSGPVPEPTIVRAWVECPECAQAQTSGGVAGIVERAKAELVNCWHCDGTGECPHCGTGCACGTCDGEGELSKDSAQAQRGAAE